MARARRFYRLSVVAGCLGGLATLATLAFAIRPIALDSPTAAQLAGACRRLLPRLDFAGVLALVVIGVALVSLVIVARAIGGELRAKRRFVSRAPLVGCAIVGGHEVTLIRDGRPRAFCAGYARPRVYLSTGALVGLSAPELNAVVAHERHHQRRRDPLRILIIRALAAGLFFLPVLRAMSERYRSLAELAADEAAATYAGRPALASALLAFGELPGGEAVVGIAPERVDHLLGERLRWHLPVSVVAGSAVAAASLAVLALRLPAALASAHVNLAMLAGEVCMLTTGGLVLMVALGGVLLARGARALRAQ